MPRIGINPMTEVRLPAAPRTIAAVITHLPDRTGYHAQRFEIIERCIQSIRDTCDLPLYVWDNGSDAWLKEWLLRIAKPEYLTLSPNIGKASARTAILRSFHPDTVICMSDDDIHYSPGWLEAHEELLWGFPGVGVVSGCPVRTGFRWGIDSTLTWARKNATLRQGRFIPDRWDYEFCESIGRDYAWHVQHSMDVDDYVVDYNGLSAFATAHHMQFIAMAGRLAGIPIWTDRAMRMEQTFDVAIDNAGLLRLTTLERYTIHMGNILDKDNANLRLRMPEEQKAPA